MSWSIGDKAVCIAGFGDMSPYVNPNGVPKVGITYLVVGINPSSRIGPGLMLAGLPTHHQYHPSRDVGWGHERFRKLVTATELAAQEIAHSTQKPVDKPASSVA